MSRPPTGTEERLYDCALTLFASRGYAQTSVRTIIETVGLSKPVLYYYCDNKVDLYGRLVERVHEKAHQGLETLVREERNPIERLRSIIHGTFEFCRADWRIPRLMFSANFGPAVPEIDSLLREYNHRRYSLILETIAEGIKRGKLKNLDTDVLALSFCSLMDHVANVFTVESSMVNKLTPELADSLLNTFLNGARC